MTQIDTSNEKVKKICDLLKNQTLDPAKEEAQQIIAKAKKRAEEIINHANEEKARILSETQKECEQKQKLLESSLKLAAKQAVSALKQEILQKLFSKEFSKSISEVLNQPKVIAKAIETIIEMYKDQHSFSSALIELPKTVSQDEIVKELSAHVADKLTKEQITIGDQEAGVIIHQTDKQIAVDISDRATQELLVRYISEHLKKYIFDTNE